MSKLTCFVGLDYHQDVVQVCVLDQHGKQRLNRGCRNDWQSIVRAVHGVLGLSTTSNSTGTGNSNSTATGTGNSNGKARARAGARNEARNEAGVIAGVAIEACGGAAHLAEQLREHAHWPVQLAHAGYVAQLKRSPDKSDYSDSRLLADLSRVGYVPRVWLASPYERDLRALVAHRQDLVNERRALKLRVGALLREHRAQPPASLRSKSTGKVSRWSHAWIAWARLAPELSEQARWIAGQLLDELPRMDQRIASVEQRLRKVTAHDTKIASLLKEAGVGFVTAWVLRAYVGRFDRFATGKQLSRYCGLSPANASSGKRQADAGLIKGCNKLLRATLIQAAQRLKRTNARWRTFADVLRRRGKPSCVIVAAIANRWMRGLWHRQREDPAAESCIASSQRPIAA